MSVFKLASELYDMVNSGQMNEALDKYYHQDCEIIEATGDVRKGLAAQKEALVKWQESLEGFHGAGTHSITANEETGVAMVESWADITFKGAPAQVRFEEVAVQHWKDGKIVKERFYYNAPGQ